LRSEYSLSYSRNFPPYIEIEEQLCINRSPPLHTPSHMNPVYAFSSYSSTFHCILSYYLSLIFQLVSFRSFPDQNFVSIYIITFSALLALRDVITPITFGREYKLSTCKFLQRSVIFCRLGANNFLTNLFGNLLNLWKTLYSRI
jgi:hypothetical protein